MAGCKTSAPQCLFLPSARPTSFCLFCVGVYLTKDGCRSGRVDWSPEKITQCTSTVQAAGSCQWTHDKFCSYGIYCFLRMPEPHVVTDQSFSLCCLHSGSVFRRAPLPDCQNIYLWVCGVSYSVSVGLYRSKSIMSSDELWRNMGPHQQVANE